MPFIEHSAKEEMEPEEPELDRDGYPTEDTLDRVREWKPTDFEGLISFITSVWWHPEHIRPGTDSEGALVRVSTLGWSGNEDLVSAMQDNGLWWMLHWWSTRRGGHYEFRKLSAYQTEAPSEPQG